MKFFFKISPVFAALLIASGLSAQAPASDFSLLQVHRDTLTVPADTAVLTLRVPFVASGTDSVWLGTKLLRRNREYTLDNARGKLKLLRKFPPGSLIVVTYRAYAVPLLPVYRAVPVVFFRQDSGRAAGVKKSPAERPSAGMRKAFPEVGQLRKSGSISRSITVGSRQGLRLDSGLRLQLEGRLTPDVRVVAALSDQNTPIQPEGTTQSLQEIDRVYIELQGPQFGARLGDFDVDYGLGRYGQYHRKLQGALLQLERGPVKVRVAGATSRGKFFTNRFRGEEGKQGPYQLRGEHGETEIIVLAGTERVWVDGERMVRGENNDYVIEYSTGQLTFTRNRLITADSRIEVDFEYSDFRFPRNLYNAEIRANLAGQKVQLGALLVREADDIQHPLEGELTQEERQLLARIGDKLDSAFVQYGRYVGEGNGNFVRMDSAGVPVYRYVGPQNGDYQVRFSYVGDGRGQYRYVGGGEYRFVGEGKGNYSARRFLPVASTQSLGVLRLSWTPWKVWQLNGEVALSQADLNRFSSLDDEDNTGSAYQIQSRLQPLALRLGRLGLGKLQAGVTLRDQGDRFVPVSRYQEVEYSRKWDLPGDKSRGERVRELSAVYTAFPGASLRLEGGSLRRGGSFRSTRKMLEAALKRKGLPELFYREERIGRDESVFSSRGSWIRRLGRAQVRLWRFTPRLRYEAEVKRDQRLADSTDAGFRFEDWTAGVALQVGGPLQISLERNLREDQTREPGTWQPSSHAEGLRYGLTLRRWHQLEMRLHVLNRQRTYSGDPARNRRTRLADFVLSFTPLQRAFTANVRFQMSTEQISRTEQIYFKVEDGRGMYRYDPDLREYVPDVFGDYILRTLATGEFESVNDALLNWNASFRPKMIWRGKRKILRGWRKWLASLRLDSYFNLNEKSRRDNPWALPVRAGHITFPDSLTVFGRYLLRQDLFLLENQLDRSLRLRFLQAGERNNRLTEGGQGSFRQEWSLRYADRLSRKFRLEAEAALRRLDRDFASAARVDRKIRSRRTKVRFSYRPNPRLEVALDGKLLLDQDRIYSPPTQVTLVSLKPNLNASFRGRGRLRLELEWAQVRARPGNRLIPFEMADGRRVGENFLWQAGLDYRISSRLMLFFSYLGRKDPDRSGILHMGKTEVRAYF